MWKSKEYDFICFYLIKKCQIETKKADYKNTTNVFCDTKYI